MSNNSAIEWTEATWNPLLGCDRVSAGCDRCYAITTATIRAGNPHPRVAAAFEGLTERRDGRLDWTGRINLLPDRLAQPLTWRKPRRIFVNSQSDLFHKDVPEDYIADVFAVMALAGQHTFQVLTKRHGRMRSLLKSPDFRKATQRATLVRAGSKAPWLVEPWWPLRNVWLGVSVEDQRWANTRVPALLDTPAAVRWLSCEPLLGPVDLREAVRDQRYACHACEFGNEGDCNTHRPERLDWVVAGGESGPGSRPMHPEWPRTLRDQCVKAGVPFFFKQWGQFALVADRPANGDLWLAPDGATADWEPGDGHVREGFGAFRWPGTRTVLVRRARNKHDTGRELNGRTWDEYPTALAAA